MDALKTYKNTLTGLEFVSTCDVHGPNIVLVSGGAEKAPEAQAKKAPAKEAAATEKRGKKK